MRSLDANVYEACDKAIQSMNRWNLEEFGKLKMSRWDEINIIRTVMALYRKSAKKARKRYYEVAYEAYLLGLYMCDVLPRKAAKMAEKAITDEWIDKILSETDFVTLYRFDAETERKAYRLAESLEAAQDKDQEINKALRFWSQQLGQYAINVTDYAVVQAFQDYGLEEIEWETAKDEKVCAECNSMDGEIFRIDEMPTKPHWGCRCMFKPVFRNK